MAGARPLLRGVEILAGERAADQGRALAQAVEAEERAHARALFLAEQDLVERLEPGAQVGEVVPLADLVNPGLYRLGVGVRGQGLDLGEQVLQCGALARVGRPIALGRLDEVAVVANRAAD